MCCACDATVFVLFDDSLRSQHRARAHPSRRPPCWSAPDIAPHPTTPLAVRGDRTGEDDSLFLFANVAGGATTTRLLFFAHLGGGSMRGPCLPANMQGWRVVWAKTAFHPPDRLLLRHWKQHTCCAQRLHTRGAKQRSRTRGGAGGAVLLLLLLLQWCDSAGHFFWKGPGLLGHPFFFLASFFLGDCRGAPRQAARVASSSPPLGALPPLFM